MINFNAPFFVMYIHYDLDGIPSRNVLWLYSDTIELARKTTGLIFGKAQEKLVAPNPYYKGGSELA